MGTPLFVPDEDKEILLAEGLRLLREGAPTNSVIALYRQAVLVLPESRRRMPDSVTKLPWFRDAMGEAIANQMRKQYKAAAKAASEPSEGGPQRIHWTVLERQRLCERAAELMHARKSMTQREALLEAQVDVLPANRNRVIYSMTQVADWFPAGVEALLVVLRDRDERASLHRKLAEVEAAIQSEHTAEVQPVTEAALREPSPVEVAPVRAPEPATAAQAMASAISLHWGAIRERLVSEVASIITEGIERAFQGVNLSPPAPTGEAPAPPEKVTLARTARPHKPSVLVVGLKGAQVTEIEADFGKELDLRFCSSDKSKDQLRMMADAADVTVAYTDFLSHSHTDIIKKRAKSYLPSSGGLTSLRAHLAKLSATQLNGHAA